MLHVFTKLHFEYGKMYKENSVLSHLFLSFLCVVCVCGGGGGGGGGVEVWYVCYKYYHILMCNLQIMYPVPTTIDELQLCVNNVIQW